MAHQTDQEHSVSSAFSAQSSAFDAITTANPVESLFRSMTRQHVLHYVRPGDLMLELNCGTGLDAVFFAQQGLHVHATDNSEGMLAQLAQKVSGLGLGDKITCGKCSFNDLSALGTEKKFDQVFSNFGGLNCAENIDQVIAGLDAHLKKEGMVHFVLIAPLCLWELAAMLKGRFRYAFRRFSRTGVRSHLEGHYFTTYYYSFSRIKRSFGKNYEVLQLRSLGCFLPPTYKDDFPASWPRLFRVLKKLELALQTTWPFNRTGDLYIVSLRKKQ